MIDYLKTADLIAKYGWSIVFVFGTEDDPPFAYTIGLHGIGLPELLVIGLDSEDSHYLLDMVARLQRDRGRAFGDGEVVDIGGRRPIKWRDSSNTQTRNNYTVQAGQFWRTEDYEVRQLLVPDKKGRFPEFPECAPPYVTVPMPGQVRH